MHRSALTAAVAAFCLAAITPAPALAQPSQTRVRYADLNLSSPEGARVFDARLRNAARQACGERMGRETLREYLRVRACKRAFIESAQARFASA
jgi:UrcA family protein